MAAQSINIFTLDLPDPDWDQGETTRINETISFTFNDDAHLQTLSSNVPVNADNIKGLLYVPQLQPVDPCANLSKQYFPSNVTRRQDLPESNFALIALAPWISINCTRSYLAAARNDPVAAFLFYHPDNSTDQPPPVNDPSWTLQDGGAWKSQNEFGVYAVPGATGNVLMKELSLYSGNMTDVPNGAELTETFDPRDFVRLFAMINLGDTGSSLPSLWVFLLIVLGILVTIISATSVAMRLIQRRHRNTLRRRVAYGEVDLEALGIKRLNVPQEILDKMPLHIYKSDDSGPPSQISQPTSAVFNPPSSIRSSNAQDERNDSPTRRLSDPSHVSVARGEAKPLPSDCTVTGLFSRPIPFTQPTCAICLDDFESNVTRVRELPCGHIFHPECVDMFLRQSSSLCPMCKKSVLPLGYCPDTITNAMVRRERLVRRMRERVTIVDLEYPDMQSDHPPVGRTMAFGSRAQRMASFHRQFGAGNQRRISSAPTPRMMEMVPNSQSHGVPPSSGPEAGQVDTARRREWGRSRIVTSLSNRRTVEDEDVEREAAQPKWRKALGSIFPTLR